MKVKTEPTITEFDPTATTFNGIPHYETWTVLNFIRENAGASVYWHKAASMVYLQTRERGDPVMKLAEMLEKSHNDTIPERVGVYGELLKATLRRVQWRDVAVQLLGEVAP